MLGGLGLTLLAQQHMGASWRIGVDPDERTDLVTGGVFARVRNPIFSAMVLFAVGVALTSGDVLSALGAAALAIGVALQVLAVEEPHLRRTHGRAYERYMDSSGRFLPRLLRPATTRDGTA
jgi:protein-S-isoprenylcysteine O-methyltransferase Ste14